MENKHGADKTEIHRHVLLRPDLGNPKSWPRLERQNMKCTQGGFGSFECSSARSHRTISRLVTFLDPAKP
eukprot:5184775-Amphidinium_carterae.1